MKFPEKQKCNQCEIPYTDCGCDTYNRAIDDCKKLNPESAKRLPTVEEIEKCLKKLGSVVSTGIESRTKISEAIHAEMSK